MAGEIQATQHRGIYIYPPPPVPLKNRAPFFVSNFDLSESPPLPPSLLLKTQNRPIISATFPLFIYFLLPLDPFDKAKLMAFQRLQLG